MNTASNLSRVFSAAMAVFCSLAIVAMLGQQVNPARLAATPHVVELERVVVTAAAPATIAAAASSTAAN